MDFHARMPAPDERSSVTVDEAEALLDKYFEGPERSSLPRFPKKQKHKLVILRHLASKLEPGRRYSEREINELLGAFNADFATLRRYLIEYRFLDRVADGSAYWRIDGV